MTIKNRQLEDSPRSLTQQTAPVTGANRGAFYPKLANSVVEAFYVDDQGREIQLTENGIPKGPPSFGEANTASNLGSVGEGIFFNKDGVDLEFKRLVAGPNIALSSDSEKIIIEAVMPSGSGEANTGANVGLTGLDVFKGKTGVQLQFRKLKAGSNISLQYSTSTDEIEIAATGSAAGEANTASNVGGGTGVFASKVSEDLQFKTLVAGTGVSISSTATEITIEASAGAGEANDGASLGAGEAVYAGMSGTTLQFNSLVAGTGISMSSSGGEITINATGAVGEANVGANSGTAVNGVGIYKEKISETLYFKRIKAGSGISITEDTDNINIINTGGAGESNDGANVGTGFGVYFGKSAPTLQFVSLVAGTNITLSYQNSNQEILIDATGGSGETNDGTSLGAGEVVYAGKSGTTLQFKSLVAGTNVSLSSDGDEITINATGGSGETNDGTSLGAGEVVYAGKSGTTLQFKSLVAGTNVSLSSDGNEITINATGGAGEINDGANVGTGVGVYDSKSSSTLQFRSLVAGTGITLTLQNSDNEILVESSGGGATVYEYSFTLPAAATLAARLGSVVGLPSGWTLATADTAGISEHGSSSTTLVVVHGLTKLGVQCAVLEQSASGFTTGWLNIDIGSAGIFRSALDTDSIGIIDIENQIDAGRDITVYLKFI